MAVHDKFCKTGHIDVTPNMSLSVSDALRKLIIGRDGGDLYVGQELRTYFPSFGVTLFTMCCPFGTYVWHVLPVANAV